MCREGSPRGSEMWLFRDPSKRKNWCEKPTWEREGERPTCKANYTFTQLLLHFLTVFFDKKPLCVIEKSFFFIEKLWFFKKSYDISMKQFLFYNEKLWFFMKNHNCSLKTLIFQSSNRFLIAKNRIFYGKQICFMKNDGFSMTIHDFQWELMIFY